MPHPHRRRALLRRATLACAAVGVVAAGLTARTGLTGIAGDAAGGVLYASLLYLLLAFAAPRARCAAVAAAAVVLCCAVELFQLTPWPAQWAGQWSPLRLVFGTTFNPWDFPAYAGGAAAAGLADRLLRRSLAPEQAQAPEHMPFACVLPRAGTPRRAVR
ncbi:DUF2809 domain-containing protein [Arthrobacter sp. ATA002]|uniref:DUF2809 domain-containing protein n=1 Tax=Arthrobacter sp. ATA002 TaxID=2991715 RepID=UPI0022A79DAB|nr:DUF2809 domain-containing protein [Arthrobacter sp. ATA002]WAP50830.1 DUF2809 domain-containing protein [Arthrobacter sp. ATA002]